MSFVIFEYSACSLSRLYGSIRLRSNMSSVAYDGPATCQHKVKQDTATLTSPWWTCKYNGFASHSLESLFQLFETISFYPPDFFAHAIDFSISFGTCKSLWVFFNGKDLLPTTRKSKGDRISSNTTKGVNNDRLAGRCCFGNICCNTSRRLSTCLRYNSLACSHCYGFRSYTKPSVSCELYAIIIFRKDQIPLVPIPLSC